MTDPTTPPRARRIPAPAAAAVRRVLVSIGLVIIAFFAFSLSFDAQTLLAVSCGIAEQGAWRYPLTVDAAIVIVTLIAMWSDADTARKVRIYLWASLGVWTATSIAGNALHILTLPAGRVTADILIAIAVNTVPAVTLFLTIHISTITVFRRKTPPHPAPGSRKARKSADAPAAAGAPSNRRAARADIPQPGVTELLRLADEEQLSGSQIAARVGRSKSWVMARIKEERDRVDVESRTA